MTKGPNSTVRWGATGPQKRRKNKQFPCREWAAEWLKSSFTDPIKEDNLELEPASLGTAVRSFDPDEAESAAPETIAHWRVPDPRDPLTSELFAAVGYYGRKTWPAGEHGRKLKARWKALRQGMALPAGRDAHIPDDWVRRRLDEARRHHWSLDVLIARIEDRDAQQDHRLHQERRTRQSTRSRPHQTAEERRHYYGN